MRGVHGKGGGAALLALPNIVYLVAMLIAPLVYLMSLSVTRYSPDRLLTNEFTLENFRIIFDASYATLFARTFRIAFLCTLITAVMSYPVAYALARTAPRWKMIGVFFIVAPLMISAVVRTYGWLIILSRGGLLNQMLAELHLPRVNLLYSETAVLFGLVQISIPIMVLPIMASIETIPRALEEASINLGATWFGVFRKVLLPLSVPGLLSGSILTFAISTSAFVTPSLLGAPSGRMIGQQIYEKVLVTFNLPEAAAITTVLIALMALLGVVAVRFSRFVHPGRD
jgi:putative spermidine/putrescine transport system permease protein